VPYQNLEKGTLTPFSGFPLKC
jgi:hypothetical protein